MTFLDENFLLPSAAGRRLYHECAAQQPILDFHNHLSPVDIASDRKFANLYEAWLETDHYKWRAMRANGIDERYITGDATPYEKFAAWAETVPYTLRNPLYHWTHLELQRYFQIDTLLSAETARAIWDETSERLQAGDISTGSILKTFNVAALCTTDDPAESLDTHRAIADSDLATGVYPTFRPDWAFRVDAPEAMNSWLDKLSARADTPINDLDGMLTALKKRHDAFHEAGGRISDHDLPRCFGHVVEGETAARIFSAARSGAAASPLEFEQFGSFLIAFLGRLDVEKGWAKQMHIGAFRNTNTRGMQQTGPDGGFDSIGDVPHGEALCAMLDQMEQSDSLPKTILYNLNPADNFLFGTMIGNFQRETPGKMQLGSGWWYLDQKEGMEWQLNALSNLGLLRRFVGMVTDSRSFLSFPRHEYFRRVLCNLIGLDVDRGELPNDDSLLFDLVQRVCYQNAAEYVDWQYRS
jgi:glucuronate isomerase